MPTYDSLSDSDKAVVQNTANLVRAGCGGPVVPTSQAMAPASGSWVWVPEK